MDICIRAYAKVNLTLDVLNKRSDGYHELCGIMQSIDLFDLLRVSQADNGINVICDCNLPYNNTIRKAAELFFDDNGGGVVISIKKNIPSEAGLGGASADAAATLIALNRVYRGTALERTPAQLQELALCVGADVPFCLNGGCAIATGIGEKLFKLPVPSLNMLIVKGKTGVSTAKLFQSLDLAEYAKASIDVETAVDAIRRRDIDTLGAFMKNALQPAATKYAPEIDAYCKGLRELGAIGACMTGSGSAVLGLFKTCEEAIAAKLSMGEPAFAAVCKSVAVGTEQLTL